MTAAIARMNLFLHGVEDFQIARGNTLARPEPSSRATGCDASTWSSPIRRTRSSSGTARRWQTDPWGRNFLGTPPQGRADYAFFQHILQSLDPKTGRCAILFPHGVLFRNEEAEMRRKLVEADLLECVLGLGPEPLLQLARWKPASSICRTRKPTERKGKVLFIDAVNEVARERAQSFLKPEHIRRGSSTPIRRFDDEPGFARVATLDEIAAQGRQPVASRSTSTADGGTRRRRAIGDLADDAGPQFDAAGASSGSRWTRSSTCSTLARARRRPDA